MADEEYILAEDTPRTPVIREVPNEPSNFRRNLVVALWVSVLVVLALFVGQNWRSIRMEFLFWDFTLKVSIALLLAALIGILLGFAIPMFWRRREK
ncbi:MAG: hypothetical protein R2845_12445 [Thermomicrobiales bacterium]